ncbi:DUF58 domain-containing protein [Hazenella sp. IB182353]|uniref:DUF58 domain-containing protein n=1 Tax=Polycladospora coralii TaxID=2771432 RepID=UPI0017473F48|nr:DUF58 domain-containing protein [Polycladospora coralii]MBS7531057.1 DUF58 domain-containing protein [Polycladospora coralii]
MSTLLDPAFLIQLEQLSLAARKPIRGTRAGQRRSKLLGSSLDFADYRPYYPGDDLRQLDWSLYARSGKHFLKTFLDEQEMQVHLYLDCSRSMNHLNAQKGWRAKQLMATLGYLALQHGDTVQLFGVGDEQAGRLPRLQGKKNIFRLFEYLSSFSYTGVSDFNEEFSRPHYWPKRQGVSIIITDGFSASGYEQAFTYLQAAQQEVHILLIHTKDEAVPYLSGDLRLIDCESEASTDVAITPAMLERYHSTFRQYFDEMEHACFQRGITYLSVSMEQELEQMVFQIFRRAGLVKS